MKISELLETNEWENQPSHGKGYIRYLNQKINSVDHRIEILNNKLENENLYGHERIRFLHLITELGKQREQIRAEQLKAKLNMKNIIHDPRLAFIHAKAVGRPMPEAEDAIAQDSESAFEYATQVLKRRFFKGEQAIAKNLELCARYKLRFGAINYEYPPNESI